MKGKNLIAACFLWIVLLVSVLAGCETVGKLPEGIEKPRAENIIQIPVFREVDLSLDRSGSIRLSR